MNTALLLAQIHGDGLVRNLFVVLIVALCVAVIYYVGRLFLQKLANPTAMMVWNGFFLLVGLVLVLNFLLSLVGRGFIDW